MQKIKINNIFFNSSSDVFFLSMKDLALWFMPFKMVSKMNMLPIGHAIFRN